MVVQNLGRVGLVLKGDWSSTTQYEKLDVIAYDGNSWVAKRSNKNVTPNTTNSDDWQLISNNADLVSTVQGYKNDAAASAAAAAASAEYGEDAVDAIAPAYSDLTFPVAKGEWCWYNGVLHVANQDISTSESWTSSHWDGAPALTEKLFTLDGVIGIYPEMYGAKGDGTTDDKDALAYAIYDACASGIPVRFSAGKTYLTSGYLNITKRINIYGNGATIKGSGTSQTEVVLVESEEGQFPAVHGKGLIENLTIDANGRNIGINVFKAQGWELNNLDICGFAEIGALIRNNFEIFAHNIRIAGTDDPDTVGMRVQASDSRFVNIVTKNVGTGILNMGWSNFYDHVHCWNTASEIVLTSVMIENQADLHLTESVLDTCSIGIKQASALPVYVSGLSIYRDDNYMPDYFTPVVFGVASTANAANIKGYGIIYNSDTRLYDLFDVDISSVNKFDWKGNNDVSIQSMGNVPELMDTYELNGEVAELKISVSEVSSALRPETDLSGEGAANKSYGLNKNAGEIVSAIAAPQSGYTAAKIACLAGDEFTLTAAIHGSGGVVDSIVAWGFVKQDGADLKMIEHSEIGVSCTGKKLVAQADGFLMVNHYTSASYSLKMKRLFHVPAAPTANGTYKLKCTVSSGTPTYSWVADT